MIVSFSVANFRSFSSEETFSLVASNRLTAHPGHCVPIPDSDEKVLRAAVLYGANGAGKSNLFKALRYVRSMALKPRSRGAGTGREMFRFRDSGAEPTSFDLQFIAAGNLYRFGFKVDDQRVLEEWLVHVSGGREKVIYERITDENGTVKIDAPGLRSAGEKLRALATVGGPQNQLFLATIKVTLDEPEIAKPITDTLAWFNNGLKLLGPAERPVSIGHMLAENSDFLRFAGEFLKSSSTGVDHLEIEREDLSKEDFRKLLAAAQSRKLFAPSSAFLTDADTGSVIVKLGGETIGIGREEGQYHYYRVTVRAAHKDQADKTVPLDLLEESDGTQRLLQLMPVLHHLRTGTAAYFIDEIDRSLHPNLVWKFLEFFLKSCVTGNSQVIVTTHESNLLDLDLLRRDEIWFAEKDSESATRLYSLMDFKVRNDLEIRKHYIQGRFGAVPFLGNLDRLLETQEHLG
jgi:hypothetical protein